MILPLLSVFCSLSTPNYLTVLQVCIKFVAICIIKSLLCSEIHSNFLVSPHSKCILFVFLWTSTPTNRDLSLILFSPSRPGPISWLLSKPWLQGPFHCLIFSEFLRPFKAVQHALRPNCLILFLAGTCILVLSPSWECKLLKSRDQVLHFCIYHSA